jgi:hypothetical protein
MALVAVATVPGFVISCHKSQVIGIPKGTYVCELSGGASLFFRFNEGATVDVGFIFNGKTSSMPGSYTIDQDSNLVVHYGVDKVTVLQMSDRLLTIVSGELKPGLKFVEKAP